MVTIMCNTIAFRTSETTDKLEKLLDLKGSRMMPIRQAPNDQIYFEL